MTYRIEHRVDGRWESLGTPSNNLFTTREGAKAAARRDGLTLDDDHKIAKYTRRCRIAVQGWGRPVDHTDCADISTYFGDIHHLADVHVFPDEDECMRLITELAAMLRDNNKREDGLQLRNCTAYPTWQEEHCRDASAVELDETGIPTQAANALRGRLELSTVDDLRAHVSEHGWTQILKTPRVGKSAIQHMRMLIG